MGGQAKRHPCGSKSPATVIVTPGPVHSTPDGGYVVVGRRRRVISAPPPPSSAFRSPRSTAPTDRVCVIIPTGVDTDEKKTSR